MSSTVVKFTNALTTPTNKRIVTDVMYLPQTLMIHDMGNTATYPSQVSPIATNTSLVNLTPTNALKTLGMKAQNNITYNSSSKSITFTKSAGAGKTMYFGANAAPFPDLGFSSAVTDLLFFVWVKISHPGGVTSGNIVRAEATGTNNSSSIFNLEYGSNAANKLGFYGGGFLAQNTSADLVSYTADTWLLFAGYHRCQNVVAYPNNSGLIKTYKNGSQVFQKIVATANYGVINNTRKFEIGDLFGGGNFEIGRIGLVKDLIANGINPDDLVASEWNQFRSNYGI